MNALDMLGGLLPAQASTVASQVGATPEQTQAAMQASVPLILNALHQNAQTPGGEAALSSALAQHDGSSLDQFAQGQLPSAQDGSAILGHAFGGQAPEAANTVAQHAGIDPQMAMQVLSMVAPLVLGALGRGQSQGESGGLGGSGGLAGMLGGLLGGGNAGAGGLGGSGLGGSDGLGGMLGGLLGAGHQSGNQAAGNSQAGNLQADAGGGLLGSLISSLDRDGDGNPLNDVMGMLGGKK